MPPLTCGSLALPGVHPHLPASGEMFGAHLAELRLLQACLQQDDDLRWELWNTDLAPSLTHTSRQPHGAPQLTTGLEEFGDRVRIRSIDDIPEIALQPSYLFLTSLPYLPRLAQLRRHIGARQMAICALTHSLYTRDMPSAYAGLLLSAQPRDHVVVASHAGLGALQHLIAASAEQLAEQLSLHQGGLATPAITRIPFGVDVPSEPGSTRESSRLLLQIPQDDFVVLYFGRISEEYKADLDPLLQSVHRARSMGHSVSLLLAGQSLDPVYSQHLQRRLNGLNLAKVAIVLENCPDFLKPALYQACDVMVSPVDSVQETFGLTILEAMAHARPVVASDWSGYRDLIRDGKTGFLVPTTWVPQAAEQAALRAILSSPLPAAHYLAQRTLLDTEVLLDRLLLLIADVGLRCSMGEAGRARVEANYTWPCIASQFLTLWRVQLSTPAPVAAPVTQPLSLFEHFSTYATTRLHPDKLLIRSSHVADDVISGWEFHDPRILHQVRRLLALTAHAPLSLGEAQHAGYPLDMILWVVKKGLCALADPGDLSA